METRYATHPSEVIGMSTQDMRDRFLIENVFVADEVTAVYSHQDRVVIAGAMPVGGSLDLPNFDELRAEYFFQRREAGVINTGGTGTISVDGTDYELEHGACLYIGRGAEKVTFTSSDGGNPAKFYLFSALAHTAHPTTLVRPGEGNQLNLGAQASSNERTINQYIYAGGVQSCQVVMGVTSLAEGSMWNTMPSHTHDRRMEAYLYFDLDDDARVVHLWGEPTETRHIFMADGQAVISPSWSIHSGVGTKAYSFVWAMAGENQAFDDMDHLEVTKLR